MMTPSATIVSPDGLRFRCSSPVPSSNRQRAAIGERGRKTAHTRPRLRSALLIATAVSAMRLEKPHSLSYQATTRTKLPSMTLVWSTAKVDECGSWLRSVETSGSSVQVRMPASRFDFAASLIALFTSSTFVLRLGDELEVDQRHVRRRHAHRAAVELALQVGDDEADRLGRAGRGRDDVQRRGAGPVEVLVQRVERRLVAGVGVDRRHEALLDADRLVHDIGDRRRGSWSCTRRWRRPCAPW